MDSKEYFSPLNNSGSSSSTSRSRSTSHGVETLNDNKDQPLIRKYGLETKDALLRLHSDMEQEIVRMKVSFDEVIKLLKNILESLKFLTLTHPPPSIE